jgi:hypothetical protein
MDNFSKETLALLAYLYIVHFKYDKALNLLKALHILYPDDSDITRTLAYAYLKNDEFSAALRMAEASIKEGMDHEKVLAANLIKGKALWGLGKEEAARHTFQNLPKLKKPKKPTETTS